MKINTIFLDKMITTFSSCDDIRCSLSHFSRSFRELSQIGAVPFGLYPTSDYQLCGRRCNSLRGNDQLFKFTITRYNFVCCFSVPTSIAYVTKFTKALLYNFTVLNTHSKKFAPIATDFAADIRPSDHW